MCASQLLLLLHSVFESVCPDKQGLFGPRTAVSHKKFLTPILSHLCLSGPVHTPFLAQRGTAPVDNKKTIV